MQNKLLKWHSATQLSLSQFWKGNRGIKKSSLWERAKSIKGKHTTLSFFSYQREKKERVVCLPLKLMALVHKLDFFISLLYKRVQPKTSIPLFSRVSHSYVGTLL